MSKNRNLWNLLYLILAIVVAAGIWFYVDEHSDRTVSVTVTDIPIEYTNQASLADNGLIRRSMSPHPIRIGNSTSPIPPLTDRASMWPR